MVEDLMTSASSEADLMTVPVETAGSTSGGGGDDGMQARLAKVESDVRHIQSDIAEIKTDIRAIKLDARSDFRLLFGALITAALGLAGLIARSAGWL